MHNIRNVMKSGLNSIVKCRGELKYKNLNDRIKNNLGHIFIQI